MFSKFASLFSRCPLGKNITRFRILSSISSLGGLIFLGYNLSIYAPVSCIGSNKDQINKDQTNKDQTNKDQTNYWNTNCPTLQNITNTDDVQTNNLYIKFATNNNKEIAIGISYLLNKTSNNNFNNIRILESLVAYEIKKYTFSELLSMSPKIFDIIQNNLKEELGHFQIQITNMRLMGMHPLLTN